MNNAMNTNTNTGTQALYSEANLLEQKADWREALLKEEQAAIPDGIEITWEMVGRWECIEDVIYELRQDAYFLRLEADDIDGPRFFLKKSASWLAATGTPLSIVEEVKTCGVETRLNVELPDGRRAWLDAADVFDSKPFEDRAAL